MQLQPFAIPYSTQWTQVQNKFTVTYTGSHLVGEAIHQISEFLGTVVSEGAHKQAEADNQEDKIQPELQEHTDIIAS